MAGVSLDGVVPNGNSNNRFWQFGGYAYPVNIGGEESTEQEVATISAAITARETNDRQTQDISTATIYPDSSLPSYNQGYYNFLKLYIFF